MTAGKPGRRRRNALGEQFVSHSREMRESPAWRHLPDKARRILERLELEHMRHGGAQNGHLSCTYDDFLKAGVRRQAVPIAIRQCVALGFLQVMRRGGLTYTGYKMPSEYRLTYVVGTATSPPATHEWRRIETNGIAKIIISGCESGTHTMSAGSGTQGKPVSGCESGTHASVPDSVLLSISTGRGRTQTKSKTKVRAA